MSVGSFHSAIGSILFYALKLALVTHILGVVSVGLSTELVLTRCKTPFLSGPVADEREPAPHQGAS